MQRISILTFILGVALPTQAVSAQSLQQRTLVKTGDVLPGLPSGVTVERVGTPAVSKDGDITFVAWLEGEGIEPGVNDSGIWRQIDGGSLDLIARTGEQAPGVETGVVFDIIQRPNINRFGRVAFSASLRGDGIDASNNIGFWSDGLTPTIEMIARLGDAAPGTEPGTVFSYFGSDYSLAQTLPYFSDSGAITLTATLSGPGVTAENDRGLWIGNAGTLELELRSGEAAVSPYADYTIDEIGSCQINSTNELYTYIRLAGDGIDSGNNGVLAVKRYGNDWQSIVRAGDHAPGLSDDVRYRSVTPGDITDDGRVSVHGRLIGTLYVNPGDGANWQENPDGSFKLVMYSYMPVSWGDGNYLFIVNSSSLGRVRTTQYSSISDGITGLVSCLLNVDTDGNYDLLHIEGEQASGLAPGILYDRFSSKGDNSSGWYFIHAELAGVGVDQTNDNGLWIGRPDSPAILIARTGDTIDVDDTPGGVDLRVITELYTLLGSGGEDGRRRNLSDTNRFAYLAFFQDGTRAIMVATVACLADVNGDGSISPSDFTAWIEAFNSRDPVCDQNGDGLCEPNDFTAWLANYNMGC